ncbi:MAG: cytochrome b/b6 domain-containing protein [Chloroflexota bacterium]
MNKRTLFILLALLGSILFLIGITAAYAKPEAAPQPQASTLHPTFAILDADGVNVLKNGKPLSTMKTCGQCHDTQYIQSHAFHSDLGLNDYKATQEMDASNGIFGEWDPLTYRYLSQPGDERLDLSTAEWLMLHGDRVVGGGPATTSRDGQPLTNLQASTANPETNILDPETGEARAWNWGDSGTVEMNCFLCHLEEPNLEARLEAIKAGEFGLANTATLFQSGLVWQTDGVLHWNQAAFQENGEISDKYITIQDPTNANCAACHGEVHPESDVPLTISACDLDYSQTATTGQVVASQRLNESGVNLANKAELDRSWDVHAERQLQCTDCHYSPNNPAHVLEAQSDNPEHLVYDPRTLEINEYLQMPNHDFARGESAQFNVAPELKGTMRRCDSCHDANVGHADWLPYIEKHMASVACESCHIPQMYAPAIQTYDWTVLTSSGTATSTCRGVEGEADSVNSLVTGFQPVLLNRTNADGTQLLAPYNLITTYYWVYDDAKGNQRPVRLLDLEAVYFENGTYAADVVSAFDADGNGSLTDDELKLDTSTKEEVIQSKLAALGLNNPRIEGIVQPYSINHNVTRGEYAVNDCESCHNEKSRISQRLPLADYAPGGVTPAFDSSNNVNATGEITADGNGALFYSPVPAKDEMYVFGSSRVSWIDWLGALLFVGSLLGVIGHGTLRFLSSRKQAQGPKRTERVYMYESYRRFWHWLQTTSIVILLLTGLIIHRPDMFGAFSFRGVVVVHNVVAAILVLNALLSIFYHVATERMQEYIPRPYGFFDDAIVQAKYYISGIFKGEGHPFEKTPNNRMNPIQKVTYFAILNVLLPLQILTGALMWGVQRWPNIAHLFGGLPSLAPFHSLVAWAFGAFIVVHVYMTTTGATPLEAIRAMVTGYENVEVHGTHEEKPSMPDNEQTASAD